MFRNTKCECGHQNPTGTVLCESCGKPQGDSEADAGIPLEMRYDGVARRSQKSNPGMIDRIWNFFSSVKIAVWLIIITLIGASLGTIFPQEDSFLNIDPSTYYADNYGPLGALYYALGLSHTYNSWWFIGLLVMIGTSLVVCSLDRVLPLYNALQKQQIRKHPRFILRQKTVYQGPVEGDADAWVEAFAAQLRSKRYRVYTEGDALLAEKYRFSRWGPYINHIGLIVFLLAVLARAIPGWQMDSYVTIPEGDTVRITGTNYYVKNEKFTVQFYSENELPTELKGQARAKLYRTEAVLYSCTSACGGTTREPELKEVARHNIEVNSPLEYKGLKLFQFDYDNTPVLKAVKPVLVDKKSGKAYGPFELPMHNPPLEYRIGPYSLTLKQNFMEFAIGEDGAPITKSRDPKAPAFVFVIQGPGLAAGGEPYIYFPLQKDKAAFSQDQINKAIADRFEIKVEGMDRVSFTEYTTFLNARVDKAMPYIWTGLGISMLGLIMGAYWQHRRIWLRIDGGSVALGAHTNKNWYGLRAETSAALAKVGIDVKPESLDNGGNHT
ncbi:cytochrome c biogenesis protein ResB [Paenibacillus beijingensis]|uniref:Cytochrome C biogenesis protein ResB n=1 Tax=Paenibacillus beijingensis TaxID=1126833 RepID=A0A0D5NQM4_9BACL|nr:cytochrome c biogenesis protein ResB [Paenibacillus beijingensis]AJY77208.1 cytochrome C biogenesis protein ResB [Paenibacillus beijingensis]